jgi:RNA polymerase sigma factor (sigma-70 family)
VDVLNRIQSFLAAPERDGCPTDEEKFSWADFYAFHDCAIRAIVSRVAESQADVDDLAQEVWKLLVLKLPKLRLNPDRGSLQAWIAALARRRARRFARRWTRHRGEVLTPELASELFDRTLDPLTAMDLQQRQRQVRAAVKKLGEPMSELNQGIVTRYWIEGKPLSAIAVELGISENRVWSVLRGARPKLVDLLRRAGLGGDFEKT